MDSESEDHSKRHQRLEDELLGQYGGVRVNLLPGRSSRSGLERTSLEHTDLLEVSAALESQLLEYVHAMRKVDEYLQKLFPESVEQSSVGSSHVHEYIDEVRRAHGELQRFYKEPSDHSSDAAQPDQNES